MTPQELREVFRLAMRWHTMAGEYGLMCAEALRQGHYDRAADCACYAAHFANPLVRAMHEKAQAVAP